MATRLKTVEYSMPILRTMSDNTLTSVPSITAYIPEFSGTVTFKKVVFEASVQEGATTTTGNYTSRVITVSVGGAGASTYSNANLYTGSGENTCVFFSGDATQHFIDNWSSDTSKSIDVQVSVDGTATTIAWVNVNVTFYITYEYDDSQTTQLKTVYLPLDCPVGALGNSKPGSALCTIPALDTELPEASKAIRNIFVVVQGNFSNTNNTTDFVTSIQIDGCSQYDTEAIEAGAASDYWMRDVAQVLYYDTAGTPAKQGMDMDTSVTRGFYLWGGAARRNHQQAYLAVTYEFNASTTTSVFVSIRLPMEIASPMGGTSSSDFQRGDREFWIEEPGSITTKNIAFYSFWDQAAPIANLYFRVGTGGWVTYTDIATVLCGGNGAMTRNDAAFTLARGRNSVNWDCYRTDTADLGFNVSGFWIINYTADKPTQGCGAASKTIRWNLAVFDTAAAVQRDISATAPVIPETTYFLSAVGTAYKYVSNSTGGAAGVTVLCRNDDDTEWLPAYIDVGYTDVETGQRHCFSQMRTTFKRFPNDADSSRFDIETTRKWRTVLNNNCASFDFLDLFFTYHTITYTVGGTISNSNGGTVTIDLHRTTTGEKVLTTSRAGDGAYSLTWYDNTEQVYCEAREDATHLGRSDNALAT